MNETVKGENRQRCGVVQIILTIQVWVVKILVYLIELNYLIEIDTGLRLLYSTPHCLGNRNPTW